MRKTTGKKETLPVVFYVEKGVQSMAICQLHEIKKTYIGSEILNGISCTLKYGEKVALVGRNGSGKTTILKIIAGEEKADNGEVHIKKGSTVGYLSQIPSVEENKSVRDVLLGAFSQTLHIAEKMRAFEDLMISNTVSKQQLEEYGKLQEQYERFGGYEIDSHVDGVAKGLGVYPFLDSPFISLSGGEKTKVALGVLLLTKPDLLLLDEPTNHLDLDSCEWLERFIQEYEGSVLIVSHDRFFLDEVATKVLDLEAGECHCYEGNYSAFSIAKEKVLLKEFQQYQEQQKKVKKMKEAIKRLREWANQANPPNEGLHKRARNMERALERMEIRKKPVLEGKKMGLQLDHGDRSGKDVLRMVGVSKSFQQTKIMANASLHLRYQDRTAIVGKNGAGKSTLLKLVTEEIMPDGGEIYLGSNVKIGYLSQQEPVQDSNKTILDVFREQARITEGQARHELARFMFYGADVFRSVKNLSGGERMRLRLAQFMHQEINLLILDEPTNHLDIDSREVLEDVLERFSGTILAVSHDRYFLNKLFDKTYWIEEGTLSFFPGSYHWAKQKKAERYAEEHVQVEQAPFKQKQRGVVNPGISCSRLEGEIQVLETELENLENHLGNEKDLDQLQKLYNKKQRLEERREKKYEELLHLEDF